MTAALCWRSSGWASLEEVHADQLVGRVAGHVAHRLVDALDRPVAAGDHAADRRRLEGDPVALRRRGAVRVSRSRSRSACSLRAEMSRMQPIVSVRSPTLTMAGADLHREARAVLARRPDRLRCVARAPRGGVVRRWRRDDEPERLPDHLVLLVAEEPLRGSVERFDQPRFVGRHDPVRHVLQHRARAHLACRAAPR